MKPFVRFTFLTALAGVLALGGCARVEPPNQQIAKSQAALSTAQGAQSHEFAPVEFTNAQEKLQRAQIAMAERDYETARYLAEQAEVDAELAYVRARTAQAQKAAQAVQENIDILRRELDAGS